MKGGSHPFAYQDAREILTAFGVDLEIGLTTIEAEKRLKRYGRNELTQVKQKGFLYRIAKQLKSPLALVLIFAGIITFLLREYIDSLVILVALAVNITIGAFQEERASYAFQKLNASQEHRARIVRDGALREIPAELLVPGDIVELRSGASVPADLRLLHAKELFVNESVLTGEWSPVLKTTQTLMAPVPLAEASNMAWMGTLIVGGHGRGMVLESGNRTQVGLIAKELQQRDHRATPLEQNIRDLARFIMYLVLVALLIIFTLGILRGQPLTEMLVLSIAVAVAALPEGLPAAVTVVLALGMEAILKRGGLVRNLLAAETLGATTMILTDKTGTLTQAKMQLTELKTLESLMAKSSSQIDDDRALLRAAILASDAFIETEGNETQALALVRGRPIEVALVLAGLDFKLSARDLISECPRLDYLQFESERRYGASLNVVSGLNRLFVSGAPEVLLEVSTYVYFEGSRKRFTTEHKQLFLDRLKVESEDGMRVIATGYKDVPWTDIAQVREESGRSAIASKLTFMGLLAFSDPVRTDVPEAMRLVKEAGARVIMVTGDNPQTAQKIARDAGIVGEHPVVYTGDEIEKRDDAELYMLLKTAHVFARTLPAQKLRLVRVLKDNGEVVAMTGDGVNDAPALANASIGVAMGSSTEVAKEASDMVLLSNSFSVIVSAIEEGRRILDNLKKVLAYLLATSSSEIIVIGSALLVGVPLPFLPTQLLWANMVEEGFMSVAFAFEPKEEGIMKRDPRTHSVRNILTPELKKLILIVSAVTGSILVGLYFVLLRTNIPLDVIRTIMFVALSLDAIFFAFSLKSLGKPLWRINPFSNRFLLLSLCVSIAMLAAAVFLPPIRYVLSLTELHPYEWLLLFYIGIANLLTIEIVKFFVFQRRGAKMPVQNA